MRHDGGPSMGLGGSGECSHEGPPGSRPAPYMGGALSPPSRCTESQGEGVTLRAHGAHRIEIDIRRVRRREADFDAEGYWDVGGDALNQASELGGLVEQPRAQAAPSDLPDGAATCAVDRW